MQLTTNKKSLIQLTTKKVKTNKIKKINTVISKTFNSNDMSWHKILIAQSSYKNEKTDPSIVPNIINCKVNLNDKTSI